MLLLTVIEGNKCIYNEEKFPSPFGCASCKNSYYKINDSLVCLSEETKRNYYFKDSLYYPCNSICETCVRTESNCLKCSKQYMENDNKDDNCCKNYYFIENNIYNCLDNNEECSNKYSMRIENTRECLEK